MSWSDTPLDRPWHEYEIRYLRNIAWVEQNCRVPSGKDRGKPVRLRWFQRWIFRGIYSECWPVRRVIISVGRKNAKTALSAMIVLLHMVGPESQANSELYSSAQSRDQAAIVFELAAKIIRYEETLNDYITIRETIKELICSERGVKYKALSADAPTTFGLSPALAIHDELGQVIGPRFKLYSAIETAASAHANPLSVVISTQAATDGDLLSVLIDDAQQRIEIYRRIKSGESDDDIAIALDCSGKLVARERERAEEGKKPNTKVFLWAAPEDADILDIETIKAANPAFGDFQNPEEILELAEDAARMPSAEAEFRNLNLNQRVEVTSPFVTKSVWVQSGDAPVMSGEIYCGLDLSETNDLTSLTVVCPSRDGFYNIKPVFWLPEEGLAERSRKDRVPYDQWVKEGYLLTSPGASIEYEYIAQYIADLFQNSDVRKVAFDRYNMRHLRPWLVKAGLSEALIDDRFDEFGQGYASMSPALRVLESLLLNAKLRHGNHPVLTMCAANSVTQRNEAGWRKFDKKRSRGRIDGMVTLAMAAAVANDAAGNSRVFPVEEESVFI